MTSNEVRVEQKGSHVVRVMMDVKKAGRGRGVGRKCHLSSFYWHCVKCNAFHV